MSNQNAATVKDDDSSTDPSPDSAAGKQSALWDQVRAQPYDSLPDLHAPSLADGPKLADPEFVSRTFVQASDVITDGRRKVIHSYGSVATAAFVPDPAANYPYTGLFRSGDPYCMVRLSLAEKPGHTLLPPANVKFTPGMALKFFLDGADASSLNLLVMYKLDGQDSTNFFANVMSNVLPAPETPQTILGDPAFAAGLVYRKLYPHPTNLSVDHLSRWNPDGSQVADADAQAPARLTFVPTQAAQSAMESADASNDFRQLLYDDIPPQTDIYDVWASDDATPLGPFGVHLGTIRTTSVFVASDFGDRLLHFQHYQKPK